MQLVYNGPHPEVVIDELDSEQVIVRGKTVDIPDDLAARLLEQNTWAQAQTVKSSLASPQTPAQSVTAASTATADDTTTKASS